MPGLVPGIHVFLAVTKAWMAGTSPAMTALKFVRHDFCPSYIGWSSQRAAQCGPPGYSSPEANVSVSL
jgi:hypothetical protein